MPRPDHRLLQRYVAECFDHQCQQRLKLAVCATSSGEKERVPSLDARSTMSAGGRPRSSGTASSQRAWVRAATSATSDGLMSASRSGLSCVRPGPLSVSVQHARFPASKRNTIGHSRLTPGACMGSLVRAQPRPACNCLLQPANRIADMYRQLSLARSNMMSAYLQRPRNMLVAGKLAQSRAEAHWQLRLRHVQVQPAHKYLHVYGRLRVMLLLVLC